MHPSAFGKSLGPWECISQYIPPLGSALPLLRMNILDDNGGDKNDDDDNDDDGDDDVQSSELGEDHQWVSDLSPCARLSSSFTRLLW